jgi:hypothetical protein
LRRILRILMPSSSSVAPAEQEKERKMGRRGGTADRQQQSG